MQPKVVSGHEAVVLNVLGIEHVIYLGGESTGGALVYAELRIPPYMGIPRHVHTREDEVFHILEGDAAFTVGDRETTVGAKATVLGPRNVPHGFRAALGRPARMLVTIAPAGIEAMFQTLATLPGGPPDMAHVAQIVGRYGISFV